MGLSCSSSPGACRTSTTAKEWEEQLTIARNTPSWCTRGDSKNNRVVVTAAQALIIKESWARVLSGETAPYLQLRIEDKQLTPLTFFYNTFYHFLFELSPEVRPMFTRRMASQGQMLANVVKFIVANLDQEKSRDAFEVALERLALKHNEIGVTANHYSCMGMCLVLAIRKCLGDEFTQDCRVAWVACYSRMMEVMIPVVSSGAVPGDLRYASRHAVHEKSVKRIGGDAYRVAASSTPSSESGKLGGQQYAEVLRSARPGMARKPGERGANGERGGGGRGGNSRGKCPVDHDEKAVAQLLQEDLPSPASTSDDPHHRPPPPLQQRHHLQPAHLGDDGGVVSESLRSPPTPSPSSPEEVTNSDQIYVVDLESPAPPFSGVVVPSTETQIP